MQETLTLKVVADAYCQRVTQSGQLGAAWLFYPTEMQRTVRTFYVYPVDEQHMEMNVEV